MSKGMENSQTTQFSHRVACVSLGIKKSLESKCSTFGFFIKYRCCSASKWPQTHQKWITTTLFRSRHTVGTLKHDLDSLFYCFITIFGVRSSFAPWCPPGPPRALLTTGMSSWTMVSHPGSLWVIFDSSGVNNSSVYTTVHYNSLWGTVVHFGGVG